jgi:hypothetical protein
LSFTEFGDEFVDRVEISTRRGEGFPPSVMALDGQRAALVFAEQEVEGERFGVGAHCAVALRVE